MDHEIRKWRHLKGQRILAAMSGGVDSSLAAAILKAAGAEVIGVFLHLWDYSRDDTQRHGSCCALEDSYDARRVADRLGIPFYSIDMRKEFRSGVVEPFIEDYANGRTPNPCERCNRKIKFGAMLALADRLGAKHIATGHYAQRKTDHDGIRIFQGKDKAKDQSYFLATSTAEQLSRVVFPVGHLLKEETRMLARAFGLPTAEKKESQDICFIPDGDRVAFLTRHGNGKGTEAGEIVDRQGRVLGRHAGINRFTYGQRRGLGLPGGPWRVVSLDSERRRVVVARDEDALIRHLTLTHFHWIRRPRAGEATQVKVRYRMDPCPCEVKIGETVEVHFVKPQPPTAPGQVAAIYAGDELLGGGLIDSIG